jgi:2-oxoglutarate dehydrogenase E1 component
LSDLSAGSFAPVMDDPWKIETATRILICSGKIYYDIHAYREKTAHNDVALLRLEQLYPFPSRGLTHIMERYPMQKEIFWVQEEHENYGAWRFVRQRLASEFPDIKVSYRGRPESASPATGRLKDHRDEQQRVVESAFDKE